MNYILAVIAAIFIAWLLVLLADTEAENEVLRAYRDIRDRQDDEGER